MPLERRRRESIVEEGKRTGIKREDAERLGMVTFEGRRAQLYRANTDTEGRVRIELDDFEGPRIALYGYYDGEDWFVETDRRRLH